MWKVGSSSKIAVAGASAGNSCAPLKIALAHQAVARWPQTTTEGATWGYASYLAWEPRTRRGVVVLSNQLTAVADIGNHLLKPSTPLEPPTITRHAEINLESKILDAYAGHDAKEEGVFLIVRERDSLTIQLPIGWGIPKFRLRPESPRDFFVAELAIRVTLQTDRSGQVNGILVYPPRGQHALPANRITPPK